MLLSAKDPNDVRGYTSSVWVHSANQIILFHFALAIYDEFDDNAMVATYAVSLSMCYCKFVLATVSHNYSDIFAQSKSTTRCAIRTQSLPIRSDTQPLASTSTEANGKCFSFVSSD